MTVEKTVGVFCSKKGKNVFLDKCLECGECLPSAVIEKILKGSAISPKRYGITEIVTPCLRRTYFRRTVERFPSLQSQYIFARGTAFHEYFSSRFNTRELKMYKQFKDFSIVGVVDAVERKEGDRVNTLIEFKSVSRVPIATYKQHELQLQGYYSILKDTLQIDRLKMVYLSMSKFRWFDVEIKDIMDYLVKRADILHKAIQGKVPPKLIDKTFCRFCAYDLECKLADAGEK